MHLCGVTKNIKIGKNATDRTLPAGQNVGLAPIPDLPTSPREGEVRLKSGQDAPNQRDVRS
jgi:hypothetical protein